MLIDKATAMVREKISLQKLAERVCVAQFYNCSGIRLSGLYGYVCEGCLAYAKNQAECGNVSLPISPCSHCGSTNPTYGSVSAGYYCVACSQKGIQLAIKTRSSY